jgi:hypothetical protein
MRFKSVLDPHFKYRSAASTDVRKTFERIKRDQRKAQPEAKANVVRKSPRKRSARA